MKTIYMEATLNIMPRAEVDALLKNKTEVKELPGDNNYIIVTLPEQ